MFNVSGRGLALIAVIAIALLILSIATSLGLFGWAVAIALGVLRRRDDGQRPAAVKSDFCSGLRLHARCRTIPVIASKTLRCLR
jgi:hypothetical protein